LTVQIEGHQIERVEGEIWKAYQNDSSFERPAGDEFFVPPSKYEDDSLFSSLTGVALIMSVLIEVS